MTKTKPLPQYLMDALVDYGDAQFYCGEWTDSGDASPDYAVVYEKSKRLERKLLRAIRRYAREAAE